MPGEAVDKITQNPYNTSQPFLPGEWPSRACLSEGRSKAVVIGWARPDHGGFLERGAGWQSSRGKGRLCSEVRPSGDAWWGLSEEALRCRGLGGRSGWSSGGLRAGLGRLSAPRTEPPLFPQMRLLLVKRGSSLPLYLRLVTEHLRLYTLYEQVAGDGNPHFLSPNPLPSLHSASSTPIPLLFLPSSCPTS